MSEAALRIGLDLGTSYIKATALDAVSHECVGHAAVASPWRVRGAFRNTRIHPDEWWNAVTVLLGRLVNSFPDRTIASISCSGISPVLVLFHPQGRRAATGYPYWHIPTLDSSRDPRGRVDERLQRLNASSQSHNMHVLDLVGYINYRLTGRMSISTAVLHDMWGATLGTHSDLLTGDPGDIVANVTSRTRAQLGIRGDPVVAFGSSDSFSALLASGARSADDKVIYLGTFGSVMRLDRAIYDSRCSPDTYRWTLSCPGYGAVIEDLAGRSGAPGLDDFFARGMAAHFGAGGNVLLLPFWVDGETVGRVKFVPSFPEGKTENIARAAGEALGWAALSRGAIAHSERVYATGGGSSNRNLLRMLSRVLEGDIVVTTLAPGAASSALLPVPFKDWNGSADVISPDVDWRAPIQSMPMGEIRKHYGVTD